MVERRSYFKFVIVFKCLNNLTHIRFGGKIDFEMPSNNGIKVTNSVIKGVIFWEDVVIAFIV